LGHTESSPSKRADVLIGGGPAPVAKALEKVLRIFGITARPAGLAPGLLKWQDTWFLCEWTALDGAHLLWVLGGGRHEPEGLLDIMRAALLREWNRPKLPCIGFVGYADRQALLAANRFRLEILAPELTAVLRWLEKAPCEISSDSSTLAGVGKAGKQSMFRCCVRSLVHGLKDGMLAGNYLSEQPELAAAVLGGLRKCYRRVCLREVAGLCMESIEALRVAGPHRGRIWSDLLRRWSAESASCTEAQPPDLAPRASRGIPFPAEPADVQQEVS